MSASDPGRTTFRSNYYPVTIGDEFDLDDELRVEIPRSSSERVVTWLDPERVREVYEHLGRILGETKAEPEPDTFGVGDLVRVSDRPAQADGGWVDPMIAGNLAVVRRTADSDGDYYVEDYLDPDLRQYVGAAYLTLEPGDALPAAPEPVPFSAELVSSGPATIAIVRTFDGEEVRLDEPEGLRIVHAADRILVRSLGDGSPTLGSFRRDFVAAAMAVEEWHEEGGE